MKTYCVVVIGHVDHGKTSLVRALTGTDTDRLPEEKARGLSITPGFAHCTYPGGVVDLVDAPGHADFIQAMISGASGAQAALVVISMADGVCAQTLEHLRIAGLLGIAQAVIAVTKSDTVPRAEHSKRLSEITQALSQTPYANALKIVCSALSGQGIETLHNALERLLAYELQNTHSPYSFLPIDRTFTLEGQGTVVTGTLLGQHLNVEDKLYLQPAGSEISIRSLQSRGVTRDRIKVGERMAANLRGINAREIARGSVLCTQGVGTPSNCIDVHLKLLSAPAKPLKHMQELRVLFGASSAVAQVRLFKGYDQEFAQLRFRKPVVGFEGQVAILRCLSPSETLGNAQFLDPEAKPTKTGDVERLGVLVAAQKRDPRAIAHALIKQGKGLAKQTDIARLARVRTDILADVLGEKFVNVNSVRITSEKQIEVAKLAIVNALTQYHLAHPLRSSAPRSVIENRSFAALFVQYVEDKLVAKGALLKAANMLSLADHDPMAKLSNAQHQSMRKIEDAYRLAGLEEPSGETLPQTDETTELKQLLLEQKRLISLHNVALKRTLVFHTDTLDWAANALGSAFAKQQPFTTSQARAALGTSRRVIVPILEHFDTIGVTIRDSDTRQIASAKAVPQSTGA